MMCEQSIIGARASVMIYDDNQKKWIPSGSSSGLSKVQIYHHQQNNTFRVVGRKLQDHEVVINCSILKGLKYNQATATFHQWRDSKFVYGLNFSSQQDAEAFARAMMHALEVLSGKVSQAMAPPIPNHTQYEEDMGYRTMTREDAAIIQQGSTVISPQTPTSQNAPSSPSQQGHHRTSSAPQPPQMSITPQQKIFSSQQNQNTYVQALPQQYNQQPIYVVSPNQNQMQIQQAPVQQLQPQAPPIPQHQINQNGGPIYVASSAAPVTAVLPNSHSTSSGLYVGHINSPLQAATAAINYGQSNGGYGSPNQAQFSVIPPQTPPQAPPPPPNLMLVASNIQQPPAPPKPPAPLLLTGATGAPPPPPPPPSSMLTSKTDEPEMNSLAAQLQMAKLKRSQKAQIQQQVQPVENSGSSTSSGGSGNYGTIGRSTTGMASMMDEMAKTLARRRQTLAQSEKKEPDSEDQNGKQRPWEKSNTLPHKLGNTGAVVVNNATNGTESPKLQRKRFGSASEETILKVNGDGFSLPNPIDLDNFKAEILREMRTELAKTKQEIIEAIKSEFNRR